MPAKFNKKLNIVESTPVPTDEPCADSVLVERVRQGDRAAFGQLVRQYEKRLLRTIYRIVGNTETTEDLTQEAFLKAYDRLESFDNSKRFGPWLFQIGVNGAIDWLRKHRKHPMVGLGDLATRDSNFDVPDADPRPAADMAQEVQHVLDQVPHDYRTVLVMRDLQGFACSEVATMIGRREPTVRWRLLKARQMFRSIWEKRESKGDEEKKSSV